MPAFCAVISCSDKYGHAEKVPFHRFPMKRPELLEKWLTFTEREKSWKPNSYSAICSRHFHDDDYNNNDRKKNLKRNAIPTIKYSSNKAQVASAAPAMRHTPATTSNLTDVKPTAKHEPIVMKLKTKHRETGNTTETDTDSETATDTDSSTDESNDESDESARAQRNAANQPRSHCRFCSELCVVATTFADNFEVYGIIQKCFPTLNIQQDDQLPKDICDLCLKHLKYFSEFIDKVLAAQNELIRKYQIERQDRKAERMLKIKQEPVVRVKQELPDYNQSLFSNLFDDEGEHEPDANAIDQKFPFDDLPLLNAQDVINDCDIMEIINLDDPFINIPDDDANTANNDDSAKSLHENQNRGVHAKTSFPSPGQVLAAHMLYEEHNYANILPNDLKQEWQPCNYKTEKLEVQELHESMQQRHSSADKGVPNSLQQMAAAQDKRPSKPKIEVVSSLTISTTQVPPNVDKPPVSKPNIVVLNNEPICSSANSFQLHACNECHLKYFSLASLNQHYAREHAEALAHEQPLDDWHNMSGELNRDGLSQTENSAKQLLAFDNPQHDAAQLISELAATAPSTAAYSNTQAVVEDGQFLMDHYEYGENTPMDSMENAIDDEQTNAQLSTQHEEQLGNYHQLMNAAQTLNTANTQSATAIYNEGQQTRQAYDSSFNSDCSIANFNHQYTSNGVTNVEKSASENLAAKVPHHNDFLPQATEPYAEHNLLPYEQANANPLKKQKIFINDVNILNVQHSFTQITQPPNAPRLDVKYDVDASSADAQFSGLAEHSYQPAQYKANMEYARLSYEQWEHIHFNETHVKNMVPAKSTSRTDSLKTNIRENTQRIKRLTTMYKELRRMYQQLLRSTSNSSDNMPAKRVPKLATRARAVWKYACHICAQRFQCIRTLLRHKQHTPHHHIPKPRRFVARCFACAHAFYSRRAFNNHQRYLCLAMPFNHLGKRLRNYKCRWCGVIAFPHWRIYCNHVAKCKLKQRKTLQPLPSQSAHKTRNPKLNASPASLSTETGNNAGHSNTRARRRKKTNYICPICNKEFPNANSFGQHRITHTTTRQYLCNLCPRKFKRQHGLKQHINGFHLEVKPFTCPICKRAYALKADMRRCKHSLIKG